MYNIQNYYILINECVGTNIRKLYSALSLRESSQGRMKLEGGPLPKARVQTSGEGTVQSSEKQNSSLVCSCES